MSRRFDIKQLPTGSYDISGSFSGSFQGDGSELSNITASLAPNYTLTSSFNAFTSSYVQDSSSFDTRILNNSGSIDILSGSFETFTQTYNTGSFTGSFIGDGNGLFNIPASGIVGLNLSQIVSGSVSASISPDSGLQINTNVTATSFTGSLSGTASFAQTASYVETAQTASYVLQAVSSSFASSGTGEFTGSFTGSFIGDGSQLTGIVSSKWSGSNPITRESDVEITGSLSTTGNISSLTLAGSDNRIVLADPQGTLDASNQTLIEAYINPTSSAALLLDNTNNWGIYGIYAGAPITGTVQGQRHYNIDYFFEAVDDNDWIRLIRG